MTADTPFVRGCGNAVPVKRTACDLSQCKPSAERVGRNISWGSAPDKLAPVPIVAPGTGANFSLAPSKAHRAKPAIRYNCKGAQFPRGLLGGWEASFTDTLWIDPKNVAAEHQRHGEHEANEKGCGNRQSHRRTRPGRPPQLTREWSGFDIRYPPSRELRWQTSNQKAPRAEATT